MDNLTIKGFVETSLCDWDGKISSVIFLPGCNLRCPFCQNGDLVLRYHDLPDIDFESIATYLDGHRGWIDGVVITGGEPTIWRGLGDLARSLKSLGFGVKLDTNGTRPGALRRLIEGGLVDYVAMDLKAPLDKRYSAASGADVDLDRIRQSIRLVRSLEDGGEFRTTLVPGMVGAEEVALIARAIEGAARYVLQAFVPENSLDSSLTQALPYDDASVSRMVEIAGDRVKLCYYRGKTGTGLS